MVRSYTIMADGYIKNKVTKNGSEEAQSEYDKFCRNTREGDILYNMDTNNMWGELFLVTAKIAVVLGNRETYSLLLLSLENKDGCLYPSGKRIDLTPKKAGWVSLLRVVGHCTYNLTASIFKHKINNGLCVVYKNTKLESIHYTPFRRPKVSKYGEDGNLTVKPTTNK